METLHRLVTPWTAQVSPETPLPEYPRPQLARTSFLNLNGIWRYRISQNPDYPSFDGEILVPFSPESALSGVSRTLQPDEYLIYERQVELPKGFNQGLILLNFGAVDQEAEVFINQMPVGKHVGGFTPFTLDITTYVGNGPFMIKVRVRDYTDTHHHQVGKQKLKPKGIFYTPQSGIWQTVWIESVPEDYIRKMKIIPSFSSGGFKFMLDVLKPLPVTVRVLFEEQEIDYQEFEQPTFFVKLKQRHEWTPESPNLYHFVITYGDDEVKTYAALRSFKRNFASDGTNRFFLNGKPYLMLGVLDQGYWPDGLLTAPDDEAYIHDILTMKSMGFNTLRKHIKVEPMRFYFHCDRLGMIVWQDMINGGSARSIAPNGALAMVGIHLWDRLYLWFGRQAKKSRAQYYRELKQMFDKLISVPSIAVWVPFNEAWGQFDAARVFAMARHIDETRLIDHASGWSDQRVGDFHSRHIYFSKVRFFHFSSRRRIIALTEFGGYALKVLDHMYNPKKAFGYKMMKDETELEEKLASLWARELGPQIKNGLSAIIYTQLSDVENEVNGLLTYDRKVVKVNPEHMRKINRDLRSVFENAVK
ncbi:MAG: sugar-binding domain-containing protein [Bacilli bacterium]|jgi:beta-galactosidase/beta-glucuronidase